MSESDIIDAQIKKKILEVQGLEEKLKTAKIYLKALEDVRLALNKGASPEPEGETTLRKGSLVDRTRDVILARGTPMHIDILMTALGREATRDSKASLTSSLAAYVRRGNIFTRPAPNTFGLVELGHEFTPQGDAKPPRGSAGSATPTTTYHSNGCRPARPSPPSPRSGRRCSRHARTSRHHPCHLYDPDLMPPNLRKAHQALDRAVDRLYRPLGFASDRERVEFLFALYVRLIAPLLATARGPRRRRRTEASR